MKTGYKQTEVGVIPEDWEVKPCSDVSERIMVGIVIRPTQYYVSSGVPAFRSANIREDGINELDLVFINNESNAILAKSQTRIGDVLTVRTGYPGTSSVVREKHAGCNCIDILITRPSSKLNSDWLARWVNSPFGKEQVLRNQGGLAQKHFNVGDMRNLVVALPPLPEQRAIAGALSEVDALLGAQEALLAKKRDLKQAAMQQLLTGHKRLPSFTGEWQLKRVYELGEVVTGGTPLTDVAMFWGEGYPWVTPTDISSNRDMFTSQRTLTQKGLNSIRVLPADTVLVTCIASIGKNAILRTTGACNQQINAVTPNKNNCVEFLYYVFEASKQYLQANAGTTATSIISKAAFAQLTFVVPPLPEQTAIAAVLSDMDAEIAALEAQRDKTRTLKQGMMQELLTGRIRLV